MWNETAATVDSSFYIGPSEIESSVPLLSASFFLLLSVYIRLFTFPRSNMSRPALFCPPAVPPPPAQDFEGQVESVGIWAGSTSSTGRAMVLRTVPGCLALLFVNLILSLTLSLLFNPIHWGQKDATIYRGVLLGFWECCCGFSLFPTRGLHEHDG